MKTAEEITRIINTTLVVENKVCVKYATEKIQKLMVEFAKEALKNASENVTVKIGADYTLDETILS